MVSPRAAVVLHLVAAASLAVAPSNGDEPAYGYAPGSANGPENWGRLSPAYKLCGEGKKQSPIDIVTKQAVSSPNLDSLTRTYAAANATLINDGHDIMMRFEGKVGTITVNGKVYSFVKVYWHSPSEHTINGQRFPLEMHLVHKSDDGNLAVIAILYQYGAPDSFYFQFKKKLAEMAKEKCNFAEESSQVAAGLVHLRSLQKRTGNYFRYTGSLTTPPCSENVVWNVLGKVRQIAKEQVDLLTAPLPAKDSRPTQPLNGRAVQFYNPTNSTVSFQV
ncbi:alpha carbonic anhydrase 1, chloroplastic-like [Phragmites australis]|uniref:alpha carbonic anhydrase 1, chloroplastic-like n=1 Tax=Phragmites australis TaxID=29695 RepID=UPI002D7701AC|nr:alpha carbonic anhydrase 1, chloroplastic-like [Phragmites australis]